MTAEWLDSDEPFFREWQARRLGQKRSMRRARDFYTAIGLSEVQMPPILTVVGSKGKGTAVAHATSVLAASGLRVGTVTSPPFRTNRERVRLDGVALPEVQYDDLADLTRKGLGHLTRDDGGYLSPTGAFTLAGASFLIAKGVDVLVLEEGLGGLSDEVSLFDPKVVAVTPIFAEHLGVLGEGVPEIAADLIGVINSTTEMVVTTQQLPCVERELQSHLGTSMFREISSVPEIFQRTVPALGAANAAVGSAAGEWLANSLGMSSDSSLVAEAAARVTLPGRLSVHPPALGTRHGPWVVDAAINSDGVEAALAWCAEHVARPVLVLASFPDVKDARACFLALGNLPVQAVTAGESYLRFDAASTPGTLVTARQAFEHADREEGVILCLGTISFVAEVLDHVDAATEEWW